MPHLNQPIFGWVQDLRQPIIFPFAEDLTISITSDIFLFITLLLQTC